MIVFWILVGAATVLVIDWLISPRSSERDAAAATAKRRYARGEIDRETFERMLDELDAADADRPIRKAGTCVSPRR